MVTKIGDPGVLEDLSRAVENPDESALDRFIQSLSLPAEEERAIISSLEALPDNAVGPSGLPKNPPAVAGPNVWA